MPRRQQAGPLPVVSTQLWIARPSHPLASLAAILQSPEKDARMSRSEALSLLQSKVTSRTSSSTALPWRPSCAPWPSHFDEDVELWGLAGLLPTLTTTSPRTTPPPTASWAPGCWQPWTLIRARLRGAGLTTTTAILATPAGPISLLLRPSHRAHHRWRAHSPRKRLAPLTPQFILQRFGEKGFARGANRDHHPHVQRNRHEPGRIRDPGFGGNASGQPGVGAVRLHRPVKVAMAAPPTSSVRPLQVRPPC